MTYLIRMALCAMALALALPAPASAQDVHGRATVVDGDTFDVAGTRIRLFGLDAPEKRQTCPGPSGEWACGQAATEFMARELAAGPVSCDGKFIGKKGRLDAVCTVNGRDVGAAIVEAGLAVTFHKRRTSAYAPQEDAARAAHRGVWQGQFERPLDFRRAQRRARYGG